MAVVVGTRRYLLSLRAQRGRRWEEIRMAGRRWPLPRVLFGGSVGGVYPPPYREVLARKAARALPGHFLSEEGTLAPVYCRKEWGVPVLPPRGGDRMAARGRF